MQDIINAITAKQATSTDYQVARLLTELLCDAQFIAEIETANGPADMGRTRYALEPAE